MLLEIPEKLITRVRGKCKSQILKDSRGWGTEKLEHTDLEPSDLPLLVEHAQTMAEIDPVAKRLIRRIGQISVAQPGKKNVNLELIADDCRAFVATLPKRWIFTENADADDTLDPYVVTSIDYHPASGSGYNYTPAHVTFDAGAMVRGDSKRASGSLYRHEFKEAVGAIDVFSILGWVPETPELVAAYEKSCAWYGELRQQAGRQLTAEGTARVCQARNSWGWQSLKEIRLDHNGEAGRVVLDDAAEWGVEKTSTHVSARGRRAKNDDEAETAEEAVKLPEHPYVRVFDMRTHSFVTTHVDNVGDYIYNRTTFERIILPPDNKELIDALVMSDKTGDDLISGKGKGVVILSSGPPGTGKTITAEAYAERAKKPLYSVQCSQLGLKPKTLETELATVLERAMRWGAILLLDEADVYIRARGDDLKQNAVVGVFLRLLEYYTGVLFMTTNRETMVDDAILSRCVVHIRYVVPGRTDSARVWALMFELFIQEPLPDKLREKLLDGFPGISPRTIKQLCRLAKTMAIRLNKPLNFEMFKWVARFQDMEKLEKLEVRNVGPT